MKAKNFILNLRKIVAGLFISLTIFSYSSFAKPLVVVSTAQYGSLVSMLAGDNLNIEILLKSSSCPHHLALKPSQIEKLKNADIVIYTDDRFETSISELQDSIKGKIIKLTEINEMEFSLDNFHLWFSIKNSKIFLTYLREVFSNMNINPQSISDNYNVAIKELDTLQEKWDESMKKIENPILVISDSFKYLPVKQDNIKHKYIKSAGSLKNTKEFKDYIDQINPSCILSSNSVKKNRILNITDNKKIIFFNSENFSNDKVSLRDLYISEMNSLIDQILDNCL